MRYGSAPAQSVSTERVVDESGRLGAISDYINPNVEAALQPALRAIQEAADKQRKQIGAQATMSGAFGDARQGVLESQLGRETSTAMGDTAAKFYQDAFDKAMAARTGDIGRMLTTDTTNANLAEQALGRLLTGATTQQNLASSDQNRMLQAIQALLSGGTLQQQTEQAGDTAAYQEFLRQQGWDASTLQVLANALKAAPYDKTDTKNTTQTVTEPNNALSGLLGSIGGKVASAAISSLIAMI
jgi:hypothetical protein